MTNQIVKDTLHPENEKGVDIYPKTSIDQVEGYTEEREDIDEKINDTKTELETNINKKLDSETFNNKLHNTNVPGSIPFRDGNNRFEVGDTNRPNDALNLKTGKSYFPNIDTPLVEAIETVYGRHNGSNASINVNKLLANVTSPIITITALETATSGSITEQDLATLQGNKNAMILFANEYYYLADDQHTSGYLTYSHVGVENGVQWIKSITITIASLSWVKTVNSIGKAKLYIHNLVFTSTTEISAINPTVVIPYINSRKESYIKDEFYSREVAAIITQLINYHNYCFPSTFISTPMGSTSIYIVTGGIQPSTLYVKMINFSDSGFNDITSFNAEFTVDNVTEVIETK